MRDGRVQMRIPSKLKASAERMAKRQHLTLTALIMQLLIAAVEADAQRGNEEVEQV
jgi:predicted HicB family RNase H-like nuclease